MVDRAVRLGTYGECGGRRGGMGQAKQRSIVSDSRIRMQKINKTFIEIGPGNTRGHLSGLFIAAFLLYFT